MTRDELYQFLGPSLAVEPEAVLLDKQETANYTLETLQITLNTLETVPAYFAYTSDKPQPLVLFNHSHGGNFTGGKSELVHSSDYLQQESFLSRLTKAGYAVGVIDMWGFGERRGKKESELFKEFLLKGHTLWGLRLYDNQQFLSYLIQRPEVDSQRIATMGMSMGGMMSWWLAAMDERIKVVVDIGGQVDYESLINERCLDHHGFYYYIPGILTNHTTLDIQRLIAPRPRLSLVGRNDLHCPLSGVKQLDAQLKEIYRDCGHADHWQCEILTGGHQETKEMDYLWQRFLREKL